MWIRNSYLVFPLQWQKMLKLCLVGSIPSHNWISLEVSHTVCQWMRSRHSIGPLMNLKYSHGQHIVPRRCILSRDNRMYICVTHTYISVFSQGNGPKVRNIILSLSVPLGCQWGIFQSSPSSYFEKKNDFTKSRTILNMAALTEYKVCKSCHCQSNVKSIATLKCQSEFTY